MKIHILQLIEGARKATGLTVVIDVFRAFSVACYAMNNNAEKIIPVGDIDLSYKLKKENSDFILVGERHEQKPKGFDYGNSPSAIIDKDFTGRTIVHTTSAGTQGIANANNASEILTGSFVNADAIAKYIKKQNPKEVSLVCMGYAAKHPIEEDTFCAEWIKNTLKGKNPDFYKMKEIIRNTSAKRFFDPAKQSFSPSADFELCLSLNKFDFVLKVQKDTDGINYLSKV